MKKLLALILALTMGLSLAACGNNGDTQDTGSPAETPAETPAEPPAETENGGAESDLAFVQDKGTLVVGITEFDPMDYRDADGNWIGFVADMAKAFAEGLGVTEDIKRGVEYLQKSSLPQAKQALLRYKKTLFGKWIRR